jgi:hypothetical protein
MARGAVAFLLFLLPKPSVEAEQRQQMVPRATSNFCPPKDNGPGIRETVYAASVELTRATLAKYIIQQARHRERDQRRLRDGALLHLAQSKLRHLPPDQRASSRMPRPIS